MDTFLISNELFSHDRRKNYDRYMESSHHPKEGMTFILNKTCKIFHISVFLQQGTPLIIST